jgi:hypothetical protein
MFSAAQDSANEPLLHRVLIGKDFLFGLMLVAIAATGLGNAAVFLTSAILSVGVKAVASKYAFGCSIVGLGVYFFSFYFLHDFTQVRLAIALAFCFLSLALLIKRKHFLYFVFSGLAIGFHAQTVLFLIATAPLLMNSKHKYLLVFVSILMMAVIFKSMTVFSEILSTRPGANVAATGIKTTAIAVVLLNASIVTMAYIGSIGRFKQIYDQEIAKVAIHLLYGGLVFLFITLSTSEALAWRGYEMFSAFGVFVIVAALRSKCNLIAITAGLGYILYNAAILIRGPLLVEYLVNDSIGVLHGWF